MKNGFCWFSLLCSNSDKVAWGIWSLSSQRIWQNWYTEHFQYTEYFEVMECYFENVLRTFSIKGFSPIGNNFVRNFQSNHKSECVSINIRSTALHCTIKLVFPRYLLHLCEFDSLCLCGAVDVCLGNSKLKVKHFQLQIVKIINLCAKMLLFVYECFKMEICKRNPLQWMH